MRTKAFFLTLRGLDLMFSSVMYISELFLCICEEVRIYIRTIQGLEKCLVDIIGVSILIYISNV